MGWPNNMSELRHSGVCAPRIWLTRPKVRRRKRHRKVKLYDQYNNPNSSLNSLYVAHNYHETHLANTSQGKAWEREWRGQTAWSTGSNRMAGVAMFVHPNSAVKLVDHKTDLTGRKFDLFHEWWMKDLVITCSIAQSQGETLQFA